MQETTIDDVAKLAGVSRATAGRVVGNYGSVSEKTREKVMKAVRQLDYQPNLIARGLRSHTTKTIALIVGSIKNNYSNALVYAVEKEAQKKGYNVIICNTHESEEKEMQHLKSLNSRKVDGVILMSSYKAGKEVGKELMGLYMGKLPIVFVDREVPGVRRDIIQSDNFQASYDATNYLIEMKHRKIGVIATANFPTVQERIYGYKEALKKSGIEIDETLIAEVKGLDEKESQMKTEELLDRHSDITALYVLNNSLSIGVLMELKKRKINVPSDISLLVWDDEEFNEFLDITTVVQPIEEIGRQATKRLFELIGETDTEPEYKCMRLKTELVMRNSCCPPLRECNSQ